MKKLILKWLGIEQLIAEKVASILAEAEKEKQRLEFMKRTSKRLLR